MSKLQEFLNTHPVDQVTQEVIISDRFKDENGKLIKFKIKAATNAEYENARKKAMAIRAKKNSTVEFDSKKFNESLVIDNTLDPDFRDAGSIKVTGTISPEGYLNKVLLSGEVNTLAEKILELSGFNKDMDEEIEEAKN